MRINSAVGNAPVFISQLNVARLLTFAALSFLPHFLGIRQTTQITLTFLELMGDRPNFRLPRGWAEDHFNDTRQVEIARRGLPRELFLFTLFKFYR